MTFAIRLGIHSQSGYGLVKLIDYKWEELEQSSNLFAILVMAHLKTKTTTNKLTDREQWKWQLIRSLYERGLSRYDIENLFIFIDKMMSLTQELQQKLLTKITEYEKEREMPFLTPTEEIFLERGEKKGRKQDIIKLLQVKFGDVPEILSKNIQKIDDLTALEELFVSSITITSLEEFTNLVNSKLPTSQE
ncbi:hypothetical protein [Sphaerospermopsis torques-reginae]|uniref:DUF4351 domain-containing protein n=1 Tax=Sphaerospermopsis torques-reginae ITEP-024 TaxID=984208 RepID=A0ABX8X2S4_9CYAN|nr:hypothetical protein [Sphaerospermopsis torques-reginae]QYX32989.1 hypothetical protein K2F26_06515 [Sphaerospermopsis torques-reginae ITEP-024]